MTVKKVTCKMHASYYSMAIKITRATNAQPSVLATGGILNMNLIM